MSAVENITTDITVADIQLILQIIEVVASRGAFKAAEFSVIGNLVTKLTTAIAPQPNDDAEHLRSVGKDREAALVEESDAIHDAVKAALEPKQLELELGL